MQELVNKNSYYTDYGDIGNQVYSLGELLIPFLAMHYKCYMQVSPAISKFE